MTTVTELSNADDVTEPGSVLHVMTATSISFVTSVMEPDMFLVADVMVPEIVLHAEDTKTSDARLVTVRENVVNAMDRVK